MKKYMGCAGGLQADKDDEESVPKGHQEEDEGHEGMFHQRAHKDEISIQRLIL